MNVATGPLLTNFHRDTVEIWVQNKMAPRLIHLRRLPLPLLGDALQWVGEVTKPCLP